MTARSAGAAGGGGGSGSSEGAPGGWRPGPGTMLMLARDGGKIGGYARLPRSRSMYGAMKGAVNGPKGPGRRPGRGGAARDSAGSAGARRNPQPSRAAGRR